jgi:two-component system, LuxR family, response regulator FixJ
MRGHVYLIDDDAAVQRGVMALLKAAGYAVSGYSSAEIFLTALATLPRSGVAILLDVCMPGMRGPQLQRRLSADGVEIPVVVMTAHGDVPIAVQAMRDGAVDFLEKPFTAEELTRALDRAFAMTPPSTIRGDPAGNEVMKRIEALTPREREVLREIIDGQSNKEIARAFNVSPRTVEVHRRNLMAKMEAGSFAELVRMSVAVGFCD